jgi:predicted amidohydrolase
LHPLRLNLLRGLLAGLLALEGGCHRGDDPQGDELLDLGSAALEAGLSRDASPRDGAPASSRDSAESKTFRVAAVQYGKDDYASGCTTDVCSLVFYGQQAKKGGARLVVFPEYALYQKTPWDLPPAVGDTPITDSRWSDTAVIKPIAKMAADQKLYVVLNLKTQETVSGATKKYNSDVAFDTTGKVIALHHKFELYSAYEKSTFTPGTSIEDSFFDTPAGKAGILICADIHCIVTGGATSTECSSTGAQMVSKFTAKKPAVVLLSNYWFTAASTTTWGALTVLKTVATATSAYVVAANTTKGSGYGGGVYGPTGKELASKVSTTASVVYADLPAK